MLQNIFEGHNLSHIFWFFNDKSWPLDIQNILHHIFLREEKKFQREFCRGKILFPLIRRIEDYRLHTLQKNCKKWKGGSIISQYSKNGKIVQLQMCVCLSYCTIGSMDKINFKKILYFTLPAPIWVASLQKIFTFFEL